MSTYAPDERPVLPRRRGAYAHTVEMQLVLLVAGAVVFVVVGRLGLRSPRVRASLLLQLGVFLLACLAGAATVVVLAILAIQQSFKHT